MLAIDNKVLEISFDIHHISLAKGAIKNNIFHSIKTHIHKNISFCFRDKYNHQADIIKLYQISIYGVSLFHQTRKGFKNANRKEKINNTLDL